MNENWCAFCISIIKNLTPEQSFERFKNANRTTNNSCITKEDIEDMIKLRETLTYSEIAKIYCIDKSAAFKRIKRFKEKQII